MTVLVGDNPILAFEGAVVVDQDHARIRVDLYRLDSAGHRIALPVNGVFRIDTRTERAQYASDRLKAVLGALHGDWRESRKTIIAQWYRATYLLADDAMWRKATDEFDAWEHSGGLDGGFATFRITGAEVLEGTEPPSVVVSVTIDGSNLRVLVPDGKPLMWQR